MLQLLSHRPERQNQNTRYLMIDPRLHLKRPSDSPVTPSGRPLLAWVPPPRPLISPGQALHRGRKGGDISPVSGARTLLLATPRAQHGEALVFIALCCVYTHFGAGCKPA